MGHSYDACHYDQMWLTTRTISQHLKLSKLQYRIILSVLGWIITEYEWCVLVIRNWVVDHFVDVLRLSGSPPFKSKDEDSLYDLIKKGELDYSDEIWTTISDNGMYCSQRHPMMTLKDASSTKLTWCFSCC